MKVALSFFGCHRRGGVERILFECAHYLAARAHDVHVYANEWDAEKASSIQYHAVPMRRRPPALRDTSFFLESTRQLAQDHYDVHNTHGCVCPVGGVHWVQSVHRAWLEQSKRFRAPLSPARIRQRLNPEHSVLLRLEAKHFRERNYRKVITTTEDVKKDLYRYYGVPPSDVVVIPNGFSPTEFNPDRRAAQRAEMRDQLGLKSDEVVLLFVANELERKGYRTLLGALARLPQAPLRLLVVGRVPEAQVQSMAAAAGVGDRVVACGPTRDVAAFHAAADLFVLPTQYEAFCFAILEALGSGLPVVTTRVPGAHDAIQPGVNGALISDPQSVSQLTMVLEPLLEADVRATLAANAPGTVKCYHWPIVLDRYEQVLREHSQ